MWLSNIGNLIYWLGPRLECVTKRNIVEEEEVKEKVDKLLKLLKHRSSRMCVVNKFTVWESTTCKYSSKTLFLFLLFFSTVFGHLIFIFKLTRRLIKLHIYLRKYCVTVLTAPKGCVYLITSTFVCQLFNFFWYCLFTSVASRQQGGRAVGKSGNKSSPPAKTELLQ